jgi:DeoR family fructose operon transcriptional repressor
MFTNERFDEILDILKENKHIDVKSLSKKLYVSEATIRRDLTEMKNLGLIIRNHGGAILPENIEEVSIFIRMNENAKDKELAASNALHFIPEFRSVFIDSSSTALALATRMDLRFKTVVTNNLQTAIQLSKKPNINLISLGGNIHYNTISSTGSTVLNLNAPCSIHQKP